jgi:ribosomal protein S18 acetylase RimI-like enzyme
VTEQAFIRPVRREDREPLLRIIRETRVFSEDEAGIAAELIDAATLNPEQQDYIINVYDDGAVQGYYCAGPTPATVGTFDLYWIAVSPAKHGSGIGKILMRHAEELVASRGGRLVIVETSSREDYTPTRKFYLAVGYEEVARIRAYYKPGDDLVVYGKYLS